MVTETPRCASQQGPRASSRARRRHRPSREGAEGALELAARGRVVRDMVQELLGLCILPLLSTIHLPPERDEFSADINNIVNRPACGGVPNRSRLPSPALADARAVPMQLGPPRMSVVFKEFNIRRAGQHCVCGPPPEERQKLSGPACPVAPTPSPPRHCVGDLRRAPKAPSPHEDVLFCLPTLRTSPGPRILEF